MKICCDTGQPIDEMTSFEKLSCYHDHCTGPEEVFELFWKDVNQEKPRKNQVIFYIESKVCDYLDTVGYDIPCTDDIDKGVYIKDNLVEYYHDVPIEEFKYWIPVPSIKR